MSETQSISEYCRVKGGFENEYNQDLSLKSRSIRSIQTNWILGGMKGVMTRRRNTSRKAISDHFLPGQGGSLVGGITLVRFSLIKPGRSYAVLLSPSPNHPKAMVLVMIQSFTLNQRLPFRPTPSLSRQSPLTSVGKTLYILRAGISG